MASARPSARNASAYTLDGNEATSAALRWSRARRSMPSAWLTLVGEPSPSHMLLTSALPPAANFEI